MSRHAFPWVTDRRTSHQGDDWRANSACRDQDPELFFSIGSGPAADYQDEHAKTVCRRCDVSDDCLQFALDQRIADGVWGGMTPAERSAYQQQQAGAGR